MTIKPFIKWVGGKRKSLKELRKNIPKEFNAYFEPFVGGGSFFFDLLNEGLLRGKKVLVSDLNENLINCYITIKNSVDDLIKELKKTDIYKHDKDFYYNNRIRFNEIKDNEKENYIERAALFIYLNKTGFNGMYRENKNGKFNIPFGKMKNPKICDEELLTEISQEFNHPYNSGIEFLYCGFEEALSKVSSKNFVYIDSPYDKTFTNYNKFSFDEEKQRNLKEKIEKIKEAFFLISNSNTTLTNELYEKHTINLIHVKYSISRTAAERSDIVEEILIKINY